MNFLGLVKKYKILLFQLVGIISVFLHFMQSTSGWMCLLSRISSINMTENVSSMTASFYAPVSVLCWNIFDWRRWEFCIHNVSNYC